MFRKLKLLYNSKRLLFNASLSVLQVVVLSFSYFFIYTLLLRKVGVSSLGIWSLILATTSVANIAGMGLSSGLVKFIAQYSKDENYQKINNLVITGFISTAILTGILAFLLYLASGYFLPKVISGDGLKEGLELLPLALLSFWINNLGSVFLSTLDGLLFSAMRGVVYILSAIFFSINAFYLITERGLYGIAMAQLFQSIFVFFLSLIFLKVVFKNFSMFPMRWDKVSFREIIGYSLKFQVINILTLLTEPITKYLLSKFGGLSLVGYYEMASRLISQIRGLIVSANQVMVPYISKMYSSPDGKDNSYIKAFNLVFTLSCLIIVNIIILAPSISFYWIGSYNNNFIFTLIVLSVGFFFNIISAPSYFSSLGMGKLNGVLYSHITISVLNFIMGYFLGISFGGSGVVVAISISFFVGALITILYYNAKFDFTLSNLFSDFNFLGIALPVAFTIIGILFYTLNLNLSPIKLLLINLGLGILYFLISISSSNYKSTVKIFLTLAKTK